MTQYSLVVTGYDLAKLQNETNAAFSARDETIAELTARINELEAAIKKTKK